MQSSKEVNFKDAAWAGRDGVVCTIVARFPDKSHMQWKCHAAPPRMAPINSYHCTITLRNNRVGNV